MIKKIIVENIKYIALFSLIIFILISTIIKGVNEMNVIDDKKNKYELNVFESENSINEKILELKKEIKNKEKEIMKINSNIDNLRIKRETKEIKNENINVENVEKKEIKIFNKSLENIKVKNNIKNNIVNMNKIEKVNNIESETNEKIKKMLGNFDLNKIKSYHLKWPVNSNKISSPFGMRQHPILGEEKFHKGVDIEIAKGGELMAGVSGIITYSGEKGNYGKLVEIERDDGLKVRYAHLSKINVEVGDEVKEGEIIGYTGNSGMSTGPHLHYEVIIGGVAVDPMKFKY